MDSRFIKIFAVGLFAVIVGLLTFFTLSVYGSVINVAPIWRTLFSILAVAIPFLFIFNIIFSEGRVGSASGMLYYPITNIAAGALLFLFFGAVVLSLVLLVSLWFGFRVSYVVGDITILLFLVFYGIGLVQARVIRVRQYHVRLPGAPLAWEGKTAVLVSDTHFGLINHVKFSDRVIAAVMSVQPDFVLHAGDFYDGPNVSTQEITNSWKKLTKTIPVFYAPGNHETYGPYEKFIQSIKDAGITVLVDGATMYEGVRIAGIGYRTKRQIANAERAIASLSSPEHMPMILINHPPLFHKSVSKIARLMVSGHTHNGQFWPFSYIVRAIFKKYSYGLNADGDLITITTAGVGTAGPPTRFLRSPEIVKITFHVS